MTSFIQDDGQGKMVDEDGNVILPIEMEVDEQMYPIENVTNFDQYLDWKPPEKGGKSVRSAAIELGIKPRTAQNWMDKDQEAPDTTVHSRASGSEASLTPDQMMENLTKQFSGLEIKRSAFHINLKRTAKDSKTTTILGAVSPYGVVNITVRIPKAQALNKKRKAASSSQTVSSGKGGIVTSHYFNFIASTLDIMDMHK
ncbi:hypothetical protein DFQ28_008300 [Apophysomyces sp. BC1034]|nr:hypothetical protein DFQ28_008300 [Apophysomyces sp. BC1034]